MLLKSILDLTNIKTILLIPPPPSAPSNFPSLRPGGTRARAVPYHRRRHRLRRRLQGYQEFRRQGKGRGGGSFRTNSGGGGGSMLHGALGGGGVIMLLFFIPVFSFEHLLISAFI